VIVPNVLEFMQKRFDVGERWQARLISEVLDFVGGRCAGKAKMVVPGQVRMRQIGVNVSAVKDISRAAGIKNSLHGHRQLIEEKVLGDPCATLPRKASQACTYEPFMLKHLPGSEDTP
jgi:hypothetical protein